MKVPRRFTTSSTTPFVSEVTMNVSSEIAWGIIRDNSSFLLKKRGKSYQSFGNLKVTDCLFFHLLFRHTGLKLCPYILCGTSASHWTLFIRSEEAVFNWGMQSDQQERHEVLLSFLPDYFDCLTDYVLCSIYSCYKLWKRYFSGTMASWTPRLLE